MWRVSQSRQSDCRAGRTVAESVAIRRPEDFSCESCPILWRAALSAGKGDIRPETPVLPCSTYPETAMNKLLVSVVALPAAIACLQAPTQSAAQSVTPAAQAGARFITNTAPQQAPFQPTAPPNTQPLYPIPQTMYEEVIAKYRIGSGHKAY